MPRKIHTHFTEMRTLRHLYRLHQGNFTIAFLHPVPDPRSNVRI